MPPVLVFEGMVGALLESGKQCMGQRFQRWRCTRESNTRSSSAWLPGNRDSGGRCGPALSQSFKLMWHEAVHLDCDCGRL